MCSPAKDKEEKFYSGNSIRAKETRNFKFRTNFFRSWLLKFPHRKFYKELDLYIRCLYIDVGRDWTIFAELQWLCNLLLSFNVIKKV